jgi:hypothetical protein
MSHTPWWIDLGNAVFSPFLARIEFFTCSSMRLTSYGTGSHDPRPRRGDMPGKQPLTASLRHNRKIP